MICKEMIPYVLMNLKKKIADATAKKEPTNFALAAGMTASAAARNCFIIDPVTGLVTIDLNVNFSTSSAYKNVNAEPLPPEARPKTNLVFYLGGSAGSNLAETRCVVDPDGFIKLARTYNSAGRTEFAANTSANAFTSFSYLP